MIRSIPEMRHNMWRIMENINSIDFIPISLRTEILDIESKNGMTVETMMDRMSKWSWQKSVLMVYDVQFKNGHPFGIRQLGFTDFHNRDIDEFVEFMHQMSFTHKVMYVEESGYVFITESNDGQTNIDADLIDAMLNAYR